MSGVARLPLGTIVHVVFVAALYLFTGMLLVLLLLVSLFIPRLLVMSIKFKFKLSERALP